MNKIISIIAIVGLLCGAMGLAGLGYIMSTEKKIAYIDINVVYEGVDAKKERQLEIDFMVNKQTQILDSLEFEITGLYDQYELTPDDQELVNDIILREKNYERLYTEFSDITNEQKNVFIEEIMTQINSDVQEYGKANEYQYILGANGSGTLMYAENGNDISNEIIQYINSKYAGE